MTRTARTSVYYSTPRELRARKRINITLADDEQLALERLHEARGVSRSLVIGELLLEAERRLVEEGR